MKLTVVTVAALASLTAFVALADDAAAPTPPYGPPAFMAKAPAAAVTVENVDGGARIVLKAKDAKQVEAVRVFAQQLADHLQQGCPMGAGPGGMMGRGRNGPHAGMMACPMLNGSQR